MTPNRQFCKPFSPSPSDTKNARESFSSLATENSIQPGPTSEPQDICIPRCWKIPEVARQGGVISPMLGQGSLDAPLCGSQGLVSQRNQNSEIPMTPSALLLRAHLLPLQDLLLQTQLEMDTTTQTIMTGVIVIFTSHLPCPRHCPKHFTHGN